MALFHFIFPGGTVVIIGKEMLLTSTRKNIIKQWNTEIRDSEIKLMDSDFT